MGPIRLFVLDDHAIVREGVRYALADVPDIEIVGEAASASVAVEVVPRLAPDVALIDVRLPDGSGVDVARNLLTTAPGVRCVMFTAVSEEDAFLQSVLASAVGYLHKGAASRDLVAAIRKAAAGESLIDPTLLDRLRRQEPPENDFAGLTPSLTPHEERILHLVAKGATNREIGDELNLAEKTVRNYVSSILSKLGARNRTEAAAYVLRHMTGMRP
jgi:two-component system, NarL family, response regulator DevR